jgi:hypothetical protein
VKGDFESESRALRVHMMVEVQTILTPFLAFTFSYNANKAHNMLALMLEPHFKSFDVVKAFIGRAKVIQIVAKYDSKTLLPLLVVTFHFLNPTINGLTKAAPIDDDSIFKVMTSNATTLHGVVEE